MTRKRGNPFAEIRNSLAAFDAEIRQSLCPTCGLPLCGVVPTAPTDMKGIVTGKIYSPGQSLHPSDAGLCAGHKTNDAKETTP